MSALGRAMSITPPVPHARYPLAIVGAGALGLHFAARLAARGPVAVLARDAATAARLRAGVRVGDARFHVDALALDELPAEPPAADWVIVLVKAADTEAAARAALRLRPRGVLSLQNGLLEDRLRAVCGAVPCGQGLTTAGAWRDASGVTPVSTGETLLPPGFEAVATLLDAAGLPARVTPDIAAARLAKLLANVAINPLAAIFRVRNGELLAPPYRAWLDALVREAWPVLRAEGLALDEAAAHAHVQAVARATAANRASMLQDVEAGRRTEIDAITGALLVLAARHVQPVPTHAAVQQMVRVLDEARAASRRTGDGGAG